MLGERNIKLSVHLVQCSDKQSVLFLTSSSFPSRTTKATRCGSAQPVASRMTVHPWLVVTPVMTGTTGEYTQDR